MNAPSSIVLGSSLLRPGSNDIVLTEKARAQHTYLIGQTQSGKSTLMLNMIRQDLEAGRGLTLLDPHGDLARKCIDYLPPRRVRDLIYVDMAYLERSFGFAPLDNVPRDHEGKVVANIVTAFLHIFDDRAIAERSQEILRSSLRALIDFSRAGHPVSLLSVAEMLRDGGYRRAVTATVRDPVIAQYWFEKFPSYTPEFRTQVIDPITNKLSMLLDDPVLRNVIGQPKGSIDFRRMMDDQKILIIRMPIARLGDVIVKVLGTLAVGAVVNAAGSREDIPLAQRIAHYLYVDEFQNFATPEFANTLSESAKWSLLLCMAHQFLKQVSDTELRSAVFGNAGTYITFRVGGEDAPVVATHLGMMPEEETGELGLGGRIVLPTERLVNLENYYADGRTLASGRPVGFSMKTNPAPNPLHQRAEVLIRESQQMYCRKRADIERGINRFLKFEAPKFSSVQASRDFLA